MRLDRVDVPGRRRRMVAAALWLAVVTLAQAAAAQNDVQRSLLETLGIDIPARPLRAPSFTLPGLDRTQVRLADLQGRVVMLYFWTTW